MKRIITALIASGLVSMSIPASSLAAVPLRNPWWGGYLEQAKPGTSFDAAETAFIVPKIDCAHTPKHGSDGTAIWAGLDGAGIAQQSKRGGTVEQAGVWLSCMPGVRRYRAFVEMFPQGPVFLPNPVQAGDYIEAVSHYTGGGHYQLDVVDAVGNRGLWQQFRTGTCNPRCLNETSEVIVERVQPARYAAKFDGRVRLFLEGFIGQQPAFPGDTSLYLTHKVSAYRGNALLTSPGPFIVGGATDGGAIGRLDVFYEGIANS
jgi:hypothetical protein